MTAVRRADEGRVTSRAALVAGMEEVARTVAGLAATADGVRVVVCLQDAAYAERHVLLLDDLARHAEVVVACAGLPRLPTGVAHARLEDDDELTRELSVVVVGPDGGAALVGTELPTTLPAPTLEDGRAFRWEATHRRTAVVAHARRLLRDLGARLEPAVAADLLARVTALADVEGDDVLPGTERLLVTVSAVDEHRHVRTPPEPGAGGLAALAGWLADAGPRAPRLGLLVVRAPVPRSQREVLRDRLQELARVGDLVVAVPPDAAMLVLPGLVGARLQQRADRVVTELRDAFSGAEVSAVAQEVPAVDARRDLVGQLGLLLARLRAPAAVG